jgi:ATP-binding cassette subfamily B protein
MDRPAQKSSSSLASVIVQGNTAVSTIRCEHCMAILPGNAKFCGQCGSVVKCDLSPLTNVDTLVMIERKVTGPLPAESEAALSPLTDADTLVMIERKATGPLPSSQHRKRASHPPFWQLLLGVVGSWSGRRVPPIIQLSVVECGAACLAMILTYYGRKTGVSEIRERCGVGRDGLSALSLVKAARSYGLRVRAISLQRNDFRLVKLPAIVHWEFNHFLVVERWSSKFVEVVDPASGRRRIPAAEFDAGFTGVVLMMEPGAQFDRQTVASPLTLRTYAVNYLKQAPLVFVQILAATLLLELLGLAVPILTAVVVDQVIPFHMTNILWLLAAGLFIVVLSQLVIMLLRALLLIYLQARLNTHVMLTSFEHLLTLPLSFFLRRSSGDILSRLASSTIIFDLLSNQLLSTILDGSFVLVYLVILLTQSPAFGLLVAAIGLLQVVLLLFSTGPMRALASRELEAQGRAQGYETETLVGIETLKAAGAEQRVFERWSNLFFNQLNSSLRRNYFSSVIRTLLSSLSALAPLLMLWFGAIQVLNHTMALGTMLALNALAAAFLAPLASLVSTGQQLQVVRSRFERIADVLKAEPEQEVERTQQPPRLTGQIRLKGVSFQYDPNSPQVLRNIHMQIEAGQKVAIVGRTGSGKSTLGKLLLGLLLPTEGEIFYDGLPLRSLNYQAVRAQFGVVMQEATIFSGSIRQNISFNDPALRMEQIVKAAQAAALHEEIVQMPMGYETFVSEGGNALSGGQRQRLALARALAHAPAILLLDEATSSLDVLTERIVEHNLNALACTQIIIAHRLSTIRHADVIVVLDEGRLVESGSHEDLLARKGSYAQLIQSQLASGEVSLR